MTKDSKILKIDRTTGTVKYRSAVIVALFLPSPIADFVEALQHIFNYYLANIPTGKLRWASIGANSEEWKKIDANTPARCRDQLSLKGARARPLTYFELKDGAQAADAQNYGIAIIGEPIDPKFPDKRTLVQMHYPESVLAEEMLEPFVENMLQLAAETPYVSGYISPVLLPGALDVWSELRAPAKRYPGYDVQDNTFARRKVGDRLRGARWITYLGPNLSTQFGGRSKLERLLEAPIVVDNCGHGTVIRAGVHPELGDARANQGTPLLRVVANVLEPVTNFRESALFRTDFAMQDEDLLRQWERRFLD